MLSEFGNLQVHTASCVNTFKGMVASADNRQEGIESVNEIVAVNLSGDVNVGTLLYYHYFGGAMGL